MVVTNLDSEQRLRDYFRVLKGAQELAPLVASLAENPVGRCLESAWVSAHAQAPGLTDADYVERLLELANKGRMPYARFLELAGGSRIEGAQAVPTSAVVAAGMLQELRGRLEVVAARNRSAIRKLASEVYRGLTGRLLLLPRFSSDGGMSYRMLALGTADALNYALTRLLDRSTGLGERLCRCRNRACGKFWLILEREHARGRTRRDYCCDKHREEEQRTQAAERAARWRANQIKARKHK